MQVFWSEDQLRHQGARFLKAGRLISSPESPARVQSILAALPGPEFSIAEPGDHGIEPLMRVHPAAFLEFLQSIHLRWVTAFGEDAAVLPNVLAGGRRTHVPQSPVGALGYYVGDLAAEIRDGTWVASYASAQCAVGAARHLLATRQPAYALCRPPGHHAGATQAMGFCFLNNAAIAAEELRQRYARVAIVDIDVHCGNGTQSIFYERADVLTASMHSDPSHYYPFHSGYEDECGAGEAMGANVNICYPADVDDAGFLAAFARLTDAVEAFAPEAVVLGLGVDALRSDPHGGHHVTPDAFAELAARLRGWGLPTIFVQEGGYDSDELGPTIARFLRVFADE